VSCFKQATHSQWLKGNMATKRQSETWRLELAWGRGGGGSDIEHRPKSSGSGFGGRGGDRRPVTFKGQLGKVIEGSHCLG
jgi:hypothetical protein